MSKRLFLLTSLVLVLSLVCNAGAQGTGTIMREVWSDIGGTLVSDLTNNANFPDNPTFGDELTLFETPTDFADNFGSRVYGWLHPATSGDYTFWIATDDSSDLYLSTDDDPANAVVICGVDGWAPARAFDGEAGAPGTRQMSAPIALEAGGKYYIEAIYKEGGGGDNLAVAWQGPDSPERSVIDGSFLSPAPWNIVLKRAKNPNPADGAIDAEAASLEWAAGPTSVSYKVYLSSDATIEESELVAETDLTIHLTALEDGASYWWRVDAIEADGTVIEGAVWSFTTLPLEAHFPSPADGAKGVESGTTLSWAAGKGVIMHDVYFGTDEALVADGDPSTFKGKVMVTSFDPGPLELFTTYYWKIDEFSVTGTNPGPVWSFSAPGYIVITSDEVTLDYDNTADPFVSELALDVPADLRFGGVADLTLRFQGKAPSGVVFDEATGTYTITGGGHDIWDNADDFHFGYRELTGDATIVARVVDNGTGSNTWAKGGVMIRQSIDAGSSHSFMPITGGGGNGASFQGRPVADGSSINSDSGEVVAPPYWVKLERVGNDFSGFISPDGVTWTQLGGANTVEMTDPVLIGLAVTSHQTGELRTFTFDNVDIVGDISADTMSTDVGDDPGGNAPAPIYVALEDSTGAVASVTHGNPAATNIETWRQWTIPLDKFEGVDATSAAKLYIGVGDGQPGGTGSITIDDVFVVKPTGAANIILVSGNHDFDADGVVDDFALRDLLEAQGHMVDYQPGNWTELDDDKIAALNAADLVIISRCSNSGDYAADETEIAQWNSITTPMLNSSTHLLRSSRWLWVDSTSILTLAPAMMELADGTQVDAIDEAEGMSSFIDAAAGNGTILATGDGLPWIMEWEAGVEFYDGSGQIAGGPRVFFTCGTQETEGVSNWGEWNLTPEGEEIYLATVNRLLPAVEKDVTVPGDIVKGVPDDGDWPGAEHPALAIDDNVSTKYLHFKGDFEPDPGTGGSGIKITPLDGPTVVTGLTFTTANDVPGRDPISFELSGSNGSIDGPYELIASGDIVDFAQEADWPRFTKNETPIKFENYTAYNHYQIIFTAIRGPVGGSVNSMQIAEVELIGLLEPDAPGSPNVKINFQQVGGEVPEGYLPDGGEVFGDRGNRYSYGWDMDIQADARNRGSGNAADERYDTLLHLQKGDNRVWEIELPNGTYDVLLVCGDPDYTDQTDTFDVEGVVVEDPDGEDNFDEYTLTVEVADGRLTIQPAAGASNCKIMFVDIAKAVPATIAWVTYHGADDVPSGDAAAAGFTQAPDIGYTDLLKANGYNVTRYITTGSPDPDVLNAADLVIVGRSASSGHYSGGGATLWNSIEAPMIVTCGYKLRSSRMGFTTGTDMPDTTGDIRLTVTDPTHPIFAGISLTDGTMDNLYAEGAVPLPTDGTISRGISINNNPLDDEGIILATISEASADTGPVGGVVIAEWPAGATMENSSGSPDDVLGGPRLIFLTGSREPSGVSSHTAGIYDLYPDGEKMFLNAVEYLLQ